MTDTGGVEAPASDSAVAGEWVLERIAWDGRFFLVDPETEIVYDEPALGLLRPFGSRAPGGELLPLLRGVLTRPSEKSPGPDGRPPRLLSTSERPGLRDRTFTSSAAWRCALDGDAPLPGPGFRDVFAEHGWRVHNSLQAQRDLISSALAVAQQKGRAASSAAAESAPAAAPPDAAADAADAPSPQSLLLGRPSADGPGGGPGVQPGVASARLEPEWLAEVLTAATPRCGDPEREYILLHIEASGATAPMTLHQMLRFVGEGEDAARAAAAPALTDWTEGRSPGGAFFIPVSPDPPAKLLAALDHIRAGLESLGGLKGLSAAFARHSSAAGNLGSSGEESGRLDGRSLLAYLREGYPDLSPLDLRYLLAFFSAWGAFTPALFTRAIGMAPRRVASRSSEDLDAGLRPYPECHPPQWPPAKEDWELHEFHFSGRSFLEDLKTGKIFVKNADVGYLEGEIVGAGIRLPDGSLDIRRRRPGAFAQGLFDVLSTERDVVRAIFESHTTYYTLTRALYWTADMLRWGVLGSREAGCGAVSRDAAALVLREVASLVPNSEPADGDHLVLQMDLRLRARPAEAADPATAANGPPSSDSGAPLLSWPDFIALLADATQALMEAAVFPADDADPSVNPHEHIIDSSVLDEERWGNNLVRDMRDVEAAFAEALGLPFPSEGPLPGTPVSPSRAAALCLSGPGGPSISVTSPELLAFLESPAVRRVCDKEVGRFAAVLNEWDVSRTGRFSLYDAKVAFEAMRPRIVAVREREPPPPPPVGGSSDK